MIGVVVNLISRASRQVAVFAGQLVRGPGSNIGRLVPSLQQMIPRVFTYRQLPQILFTPTGRTSATTLIRTVFARTAKSVFVVGGFSGFGYLVNEVYEACQEERMTDGEMADVITSQVFSKLAEQTVRQELEEEEERRRKLTEEERKQIIEREKKEEEEDRAREETEREKLEEEKVLKILTKAEDERKKKEYEEKKRAEEDEKELEKKEAEEQQKLAARLAQAKKDKQDAEKKAQEERDAEKKRLKEILGIQKDETTGSPATTSTTTGTTTTTTSTTTATTEAASSSKKKCLPIHGCRIETSPKFQADHLIQNNSGGNVSIISLTSIIVCMSIILCCNYM